MARILMIGFRYNEVPGGWHFSREMARRLAALGHSITFLTFRLPKTSGHDFLDGVDVFRVKTLYLPQIPLLIPDPTDLLRLMKFILRKKVQVVYDVSSGVTPISSCVYLYLRALGFKTPWMTHVCGELKDFARNSVRRVLFEAYLRTVSKLSMTHSDLVLAAGEPVRNRVLSLSVAPEKVKIVKVGLRESNSKFPKQEISSSVARKTLGIPASDF